MANPASAMDTMTLNITNNLEFIFGFFLHFFRTVSIFNYNQLLDLQILLYIFFQDFILDSKSTRKMNKY